MVVAELHRVGKLCPGRQSPRGSVQMRTTLQRAVDKPATTHLPNPRDHRKLPHTPQQYRRLLCDFSSYLINCFCYVISLNFTITSQDFPVHHHSTEHHEPTATYVESFHQEVLHITDIRIQHKTYTMGGLNTKDTPARQRNRSRVYTV